MHVKTMVEDVKCVNYVTFSELYTTQKIQMMNNFVAS